MLIRHLVMAPEDSGEGSGSGEGVGEGGDPTSTALDQKEGGAPTTYDWHTDIHPDVANDEVWKSVPDVKTLTKSYADAVKYNVGAVKMPGKDATPEDWSSFYKKLGRPESAEGYVLNERLKDDAAAQQMRGVAHSAGLTPQQWETISSGWTRITDEGVKTQAAKRDQVVGELQGEWGAAFDRKIGLVQRTIRTFGGEETFEELSRNPIGNSKGFLMMMAQLAEAMAEEELIGGEVEGVTSKEDAKAELDTLTASQVYLKADVAGHDQAVKRAKQLFEIVYN